MNSLRNKLIASVTMLAVAAIMLTSASFAWYTVSTRGDVEQIKVEMKATKNLEIAKVKDMGVTTPSEADIGDAGDETKWGSKITTWEDLATIEKVDLPATLSQTKMAVCTVDYDKTGRIASEASLSEGYYTNTTPFVNGFEYVLADFEADNIPDGQKIGVAYGIWIRSNTDLDDVIGHYDTSAVTGKAGEAVTVVFRDPAERTIYTADAPLTLQANEPKYIEVIVFFDGDKLKAEDVVDELKADGIKVSFTSEQVLE